jgi:hypothetical protein
MRSAGERFDLQVRRGRAWRSLATRSPRTTFALTLPRGATLRARSVAADGSPGPWRQRRLPR